MSKNITKSLIMDDFRKECENLYDNTPTKKQFIAMFNDVISDINVKMNINLPSLVEERSKTITDITYDKDRFIQMNEKYVLDDTWMRNLIMRRIGYLVQYIEEGANSPEALAIQRQYDVSLQRFAANVDLIVPEIYNQTPGVVEDGEDYDAFNMQNPSSNPFGRGDF